MVKSYSGTAETEQKHYSKNKKNVKDFFRNFSNFFGKDLDEVKKIGNR